MSFTAQQILALAPDVSSAKSGQGLAVVRHWVTLGSDENALWGECQGSGKKPYQTQIDLSEPAFKCSCPSRKFPCKHGLGLFLLFAAQPDQLPKSAQPVWVSDWLASRTKRAEQKVEKIAKQAEEIADPQAQAKRAANRETKVAAGLRELELWLHDLVRNGLAAPQIQDHKFWETPTKRVVDAQAPGLARLLQLAASQRVFGSSGYDRMLKQLAKIHLLVEGYKRIDTLPADTQGDIRTLIGWAQNQDELLLQAGVKDKWFVLGQRVTEEEKLRLQATWLRGATTKRNALILQYAHASQVLDTSLIIGSVIEAELVFFASAYPLRALVKERGAIAFDTPNFATNVAQVIESYAAALALQPWLERFPAALQNVIPFRRGEQWFVRDAENHVLPLAQNFTKPWELVAVSGGQAVQLFGEWDGEFLLPLSVWINGKLVKL